MTPKLPFIQKFSATLALLVLLVMPGVGWGQISMTSTGNHTQNFDVLSSSGTSNAWTDNTTIASWYSQRTGTGTTYTADAGSGTAGNLYSYGTGTVIERALGTIGSGNAAAGSFSHGVLLRNASGAAITDIKVSYTLEQWRKSGVIVAQDITFWYKISPSVISALNPNSNATWTQVTGLTLSSPINTATGVALDGNASANKTTATAVSIPSLSLSNDDYIMLKWEDPDHAGTDHGLSIDDVTISWTVATATPTLTVTPATLSGFTYVVGSGPSAEQSFTVSGANLTNSVSVAASTNYEISKTSGGTGWTSPLTFTAAEATTAKTVYVRLKAGLFVGNYNGEVINITSTDAAPKTVTCSGSVTAIAPTLTVTPVTLSGFTYVVGSGPSAEQNFTVSGAYLIDDVFIDAAADYEISTDNGASFSATDPIQLTPVSGTLGETLIYVRLKTGLAAGNYNGELISATSTDADDVTVACNGNVTPIIPPVPTAWINEIHYDNAGTDAGEFVEVVVENSSGVNLAQLRVHLYNGNGGAVYGTTTSLDTYTAGVTSNNFTIYTFAIAGIQNGAPDGLALSYFDVLIPGQFLSYEGSFTATNGPASGVTSVDIGVSENGTGVATNSLQLGGVGTEYNDFYWQTEATNTLGLVNNNQSFFTSTIWDGSESTAWELSGNWSQGVPVQGMDVQIPDVSNDPLISANAFAADLTISPGATLILASSGRLTVSGTLTTNNGLTIQNGASLITNGTVTGEATVNKTISGTTFHLFTLPVNESVTAMPLFEGYYVDEYIEANGAWTRLVDASSLSPLKGYSIANESGSADLSFTGNLFTGNQTFSNLSYTEAAIGYGSGWNLIGNSFPSALDLDLGGITYTGLNGYVYVWDGTQFLAGPTNPGGYGTLTGNIIPASQGFFIRTTQAAASFTLPNSARVHSSQAFYKNTQEYTNVISLQVLGNNAEDNMLFVINPQASAGFDQQFDAYKLFGNADAPQLYTLVENENTSISALPAVEGTTELPVMLKVGADGEYSLTAGHLDTFMEGTIVYLNDNLTGLRQDLRQNPVYIFNASVSDEVNRFKLSFAAVGINETPGLNIGIYAAGNEIRLQLPEVMEGTVSITTLDGRILNNTRFNGTGEVSVRTNVSGGIYLVTVTTEKGTLSRKVLVK